MAKELHTGGPACVIDSLRQERQGSALWYRSSLQSLPPRTYQTVTLPMSEDKGLLG